MKKSRGALIVLEGLDKSGKTTQIKSCLEILKADGLDVCQLSFPDRTTSTGQLISSFLREQTILDDRAVHLLFSANRWEKWKEMNEWLSNGTSILVDRYAYSGVAYTASKGYDLDWCLGPDKGLIAPDLVVYLSASSTVLESRSGYGEERYENKAFQSRVSETFEKLKTKKWLTVYSDRPIEEVTHDIITPMRNTIRGCLSGSLESGTLWKDG
ncbi:hypothetical protein GpartN1_g3374.t1 [Galdieria partita]|uniref:Thymidylate kinase n=1 Tax=Galdieria partita TaxID=83374 RepID=A0A9C7PVD7_9RHOD|nr:hypothetical protein GpartN1_g3374.t1 [Galdieria partita]